MERPGQPEQNGLTPVQLDLLPHCCASDLAEHVQAGIHPGTAWMPSLLEEWLVGGKEVKIPSSKENNAASKKRSTCKYQGETAERSWEMLVHFLLSRSNARAGYPF